MSDQLPLYVSVEDVEQLVQSGESFLMLDCRRDEEYALVNLPGAVLIPMDEIPQRLGELDDHRTDRIVVYCHMGVRSETVCQWLRGQGFPNAQTMSGGIEAWALKIDKSLHRY